MDTRTLSLLAPAAFLCASLPIAWIPGASTDDGLVPSRTWDGERFVVHEWGTFVSVAGSDGEPLAGLVHDPFELPPFVYDLCDELALTGLTPKMETPVLYFYAPRPWAVRVRVGFPHGLLTQWYPAATQANLRGGDGLPATAEIEPGSPRLVDGFLDWGRFGELLVLGPEQDYDACSPEARETSLACFPEVDAGDPWQRSREVDANALRVTSWSQPDGEEMRAREEYERFLFYRGLGDFALPLRARLEQEEVLVDANGEARVRLRLVLENTDPAQPLEHLFLVVVVDGSVAFRALDDLAGSAEYELLELPLVEGGAGLDELAVRIADHLHATGLYRDEALAMARTWQASWFGEDGTRLLYVVPAALIERELPLRVEGHDVPGPEGLAAPGPQPEEIVRTFVGRIELLSPERERTILETFTRAGAGTSNEREREAAREEIARWGRYAAPYLERARTLGAELVSTR